MKRSTYYMFLCVEAVLCVVLCILQVSFTGVFSSITAFPFEQIGLGLRNLSLSGGPGNAAAIVIYAAVSLLPAAVLLVLSKKRSLHAEDGLLILLSIVLFAVLYLMINPGSIGMLTGGLTEYSAGKSLLGVIVYSIVCGHLVLRLLRLFNGGGTDALVRYMSAILHLLNMLLVYIIFSTCLGYLFDSIASLKAGNAGNEHLLGASYFFLALQFIVGALPYAMDIFVVFAALRLLREMQTDRYSEKTVTAAERMSRLCTAALTVTVLSNIGLNLFQLLFAKSLMVIDTAVQIPIFSMTFVLAALLLTRFVTENKQLKDDNDTFI